MLWFGYYRRFFLVHRNVPKINGVRSICSAVNDHFNNGVPRDVVSSIFPGRSSSLSVVQSSIQQIRHMSKKKSKESHGDGKRRKSNIRNSRRPQKSQAMPHDDSIDLENYHNMEWTDNYKQQRQLTPKRRSSQRHSPFTAHDEIDATMQSVAVMKKQQQLHQQRHQLNPLMITCTKPSQITSLHPAVRLALLHDEVRLEFRTIHENPNVDPNIWY